MDHNANIMIEGRRIPHARFKRIRRGLRVQGMGGALLFASFFMPAVKGCSSPITPAGFAWDCMAGDNSTMEEWLMWFLVAIVPYSIGLLMALSVFTTREKRRFVESTGGRFVALVGVAAALAAITLLVWAIVNVQAADFLSSSFAISLCYTLIVFQLPAVMARGAAGLSCLRWTVASCVFVWFVGFIGLGLADGGSPLYGMWCSLIGSGAIVVGIVLEASPRSGKSAFRTMGCLTLCRLVPDAVIEGRCVECGYTLKGLTSPRCPECGVEFRWEDYGGRDRFAVESVVAACEQRSS